MRAHYLAVLELGADATKSDIKKAYRRLSKRYHPDICKEPNATERFIEIDEAYDFLINNSGRSESSQNEERPFYTQQETEYERWRREARARRRAEELERRVQLEALLIRINRIFTYLILVSISANLLFLADISLPSSTSTQLILEYQGVYKGKYGTTKRPYYAYDKIIFERSTLIVEKGSIAKIKEATSGLVRSTYLLDIPLSCTVVVDEEEKTLKHRLSIYYPFGFMIPLALLLCALFFCRKNANAKLTLGIVMGMLALLQLVVSLAA